MSYKVIKGLSWLNIDGKNVLILTKDWHGTSIISCKADFILINEEVYNRYKSKFIAGALESKIIFWEDLNHIGAK